MSSVFVQTNELDSNHVIAFRREPSGTLTTLGRYPTGGAGSGSPHLPSQGSVVLSGDRNSLLVANAGSGDISAFAVAEDGLSLTQTITTGDSPRSIAEHAGLVYVLNTGTPSLAGFRLDAHGLTELAGCRVASSPRAPIRPRSASRPTALAIVVTQRGTNSIVVFAVDEERPAHRPARDPVLRADAVRLRVRCRRLARRDRGLRRPDR